ncbi:hypothetical protein [Campylobacter concisus]|uniref:hypothetical protein n=1 Tax=Campylobacter concisus TaxID=199 RepID=UPI003D23936E
MRDIEINSVADLFEAKDFIIQTQSDVKISKVSSLEYKIKLDGGRFNDFDLSYIDADVAKIIVEYQTQYDNFIVGLEQKFNIQIPQSQRMLKFKLEKGCLEISADVKAMLMGVINNMQDWQTMTVALVAICGFFAYKSYHKFLDTQVEKIKVQAQQARDEAEQRRLETLSKMVENLSADRSLQEPANRVKKSIAEVLQDQEKAIIAPELDDQINAPITSADKDKFRVVLSQTEVPDIEEEIDDLFHIQSQFFTSERPFRVKELGNVNLNSDILSLEKRITLIQKAEKQEPVNLKIKLIKDGKTQKIKNAYILDVLK